ncbi:MAG: TetR/AcrR family transcriptional regulator [Oscillospiraceae bacterium]|nr:TetR/AcrR family transcriptional regulator [Oscillospiraceae bacterium]
MPGEGEDRRVRKTKALLRESLQRLLLEKPLREITVKELTEAADVNRGTFYSHYRDIYDLRDQIEEELFREFVSMMDSYPADKLRRGLRPILTDVFRFILRNAGTGAVLFGPAVYSGFLDRIKAELHRRVGEEWQGLYGFQGSAQWNYYLEFVVAGCIALLQTWTGKGMRETPEEMAAMAERFILFGLRE